MNITFAEFQKLIAPLIGMTISHPWKGYGSTIFLELGALTEGRNNPKGDACITVEDDWRVENDQSIVFGSSESASEISRSLPSIAGLKIRDIFVDGAPPEICVHLTNGNRLRTMAAAPGDPQWSIRMPDGQWLYCRAGELLLDDGSGGHETKASETTAMDHAKSTAQRWSKSEGAREANACRDCRYFVWLDGDYFLLDYGVCTNAASTNDGRALNCGCGCAEFSLKVHDEV